LTGQLGHPAGEQHRLVGGLHDRGVFVHALRDECPRAALAVVSRLGEQIGGDLGRVGDRQGGRERSWRVDDPHGPAAILATGPVGVAVDLVEQVVVVLDRTGGAPVVDVGQ